MCSHGAQHTPATYQHNNNNNPLQQKQNTAARQTFKEHESIVYQQLAQLIRDAVWLKSYIVAVMRLEQEAFTSAYGAVGPIQNAPMASIAPESNTLHSTNDSIGLPAKPQPVRLVVC